MEGNWIQIIKTGKRIFINGTETNIIEVDGVKLEIWKDVPKKAQLYIRRVEEKRQPVWDEI